MLQISNTINKKIKKCNNTYENDKELDFENSHEYDLKIKYFYPNNLKENLFLQNLLKRFDNYYKK